MMLLAESPWTTLLILIGMAAAVVMVRVQAPEPCALASRSRGRRPHLTLPEWMLRQRSPSSVTS